jgi:hypothetical protein
MNEFSQFDEHTVSMAPFQIEITCLGFACVLRAGMAKTQETPNHAKETSEWTSRRLLFRLTAPFPSGMQRVGAESRIERHIPMVNLHQVGLTMYGPWIKVNVCTRRESPSNRTRASSGK